MTIKINNTEICLRPSSIDTFQQCPYQWAKVFLEGGMSIPGARAAIGTGIHRGIEVMWNEAIVSKKKDPNATMMTDASIDAFHEEGKKGLRYDSGENASTAEKAIKGGIEAYIEDCVPWLDIPKAVETRFEVAITDHPIVNAVGGTVDYLADGIIDDVKTSKRKPTVANYMTQQSIYRYLAEANGVPVVLNRIQGVVLKAKPDGHILDMLIDVDRAKYVVNTLLDTIELASKDLVPIDQLFRCNTKYYLCSEKYCAFHGSCPATKTTVKLVEKPVL